MERHRSDVIIEEIIGGFKVFLISALCVYFAIAIINALPNINFPIKENSQWITAIILGLLITFVSYVKKKNKSYFN